MNSNLGAGFTTPAIGESSFYIQIAANGIVDQKIYRITLSGEKTVAADLSRLSLGSGIRPEEVALQDYAANPSGGVDLLLRRNLGSNGNPSEARTLVARFASNGDLRRVTEITTSFYPTHLAPFATGSSWLIVGYPISRDKRTNPTPTAIITDEQGMVFPIRLSQLGIESTKHVPNSTSTEKEKKVDFLNSIDAASFMNLAADSSNYVYAYSLFSPGHVDRIAQNGEVVRLQIKMPSVDADKKLQPVAMLARNHQLIFHLGIIRQDAPTTGGFLINQYLFPVYNSDNGELLKTYTVEGKIGHGLVGYSPGNLYFLSGVPNKEKTSVSYSIFDMVPD